MSKTNDYLQAWAELSKEKIPYYDSATGKGLGCSDATLECLRRAKIISKNETFWAGQGRIGVLADTTRFRKLVWDPSILKPGHILWSHGHHVATWAGIRNGLYEAAPESTHSVAEGGTGVGLHVNHGYYNCGTGTNTWTCIYEIIDDDNYMIDSITARERAIKLAWGDYGPTSYNNDYPYNVGKWDGSKWSFDCLGLVHTITNGFIGDKTKLGGGAVMDDFVNYTNEIATLNTCTYKSKFNGVEPKKMSLLYKSGHVGFYIGEHKVLRANGDTDIYNAVECTTAWGGGVLFSWVDIRNGYRYNKKGGELRSLWDYHGELSRINYIDKEPDPVPQPEPKPVIELTPAEKLGIAIDIINGKYGNNPKRREVLAASYGTDVAIQIQELVNKAFE